MKIGVCGIVCEKCVSTQNPMCPTAIYAFNIGVRLCFECSDFPHENTAEVPISCSYCKYLSEKAQLQNMLKIC